MVYHPRPYDESFAYAFPADGVEIITRSRPRNIALFIPGGATIAETALARFCGNGSLALDWTTILREHPYNGDAFY